MAYNIRILHLHRVSCSSCFCDEKVATTECTQQALSFTCPTIQFSHMAQNNPKTFKRAEQPNIMRLSQANEKISFTDHSIYNDICLPSLKPMVICFFFFLSTVMIFFFFCAVGQIAWKCLYQLFFLCTQFYKYKTLSVVLIKSDGRWKNKNRSQSFCHLTLQLSQAWVAAIYCICILILYCYSLCWIFPNPFFSKENLLHGNYLYLSSLCSLCEADTSPTSHLAHLQRHAYQAQLPWLLPKWSWLGQV